MNFTKFRLHVYVAIRNVVFESIRGPLFSRHRDAAIDGTLVPERRFSWDVFVHYGGVLFFPCVPLNPSRGKLLNALGCVVIIRLIQNGVARETLIPHTVLRLAAL